MLRDYNEKRVIFWLFLFMLSAYTLVASGHYGGDAINNYLVTKSVVERGCLYISRDMLSVEEVKIEVVGTPGRGGKYYSHFGCLLVAAFHCLRTGNFFKR